MRSWHSSLQLSAKAVPGGEPTQRCTAQQRSGTLRKRRTAVDLVQQLVLVSTDQTIEECSHFLPISLGGSPRKACVSSVSRRKSFRTCFLGANELSYCPKLIPYDENRILVRLRTTWALPFSSIWSMSRPTDERIESYYLAPCRSFVTACQICLMHDAFQPMKHDRRLLLLIDCSHGSLCRSSAGLSKVHYCWSLHAYHIAFIGPIAVAPEAYDRIPGRLKFARPAVLGLLHPRRSSGR